MKKRRITKKRKLRNQKKTLFVSLLLSICLLTIGYAAFQTTINLNVKGNIKIDERCVVGNVFDFEQKNEVQEFSVPCSGTYKLETWGASGGSQTGVKENNGCYSLSIGGYGGYSVGNILLKKGNNLYIVVGEKGKNVTNLSSKNIGGYNGGGYGGGSVSENYVGSGGGGGATHIALSTGLLYTFENNQNNLLIVSGGGGGASFGNPLYCNNNQSTDGCGLNNNPSAGGYIGVTTINSQSNKQSIGGSQSEGYSFGIGQDGADGISGNACSGEGSGGGGGGFYGGLTNQELVSIYNNTHGGGGSSYIGNTSLTNKFMYCYDCEESLDTTKPEIFTVSTTGTSSYRDTVNCPDGYSENPISKCAKTGNGYARITLISKKTN